MVNLLEQSKGKKQVDSSKQIVDVQKKMSELNDRARILEERIKNLREKLHVVNQTALSNVKEINEVNSSQNARIDDMKKEIEDMKNTIRKIAKGLSSKARDADVKILEKYIEMMDSTRFISEKDVEKIIDERLKSLKSEV